MENKIWRLDSDSLACFTADPEVWRKIRLSYPDFTVMARYYEEGSLYAIHYRISNERKRSARHLLGVNVSRT